MNIDNKVSNKLFIVCPFCQMEKFTEKHFGNGFFVTASAAMLHLENEEIDIIKELLERENIRKIFLLGETTCNFTKNALVNFQYSDIRCEAEIQKIKSPDDTPETLTKKLLIHQANILRSQEFFGDQIASGSIVLHTIQSVQNENKILEIN